jgi:hypothetical protein
MFANIEFCTAVVHSAQELNPFLPFLVIIRESEAEMRKIMALNRLVSLVELYL